MQLAISHITRYAYEPEAAGAALRLRLFPPETSAQKPLDWRVTVNGAEVAPLLTEANGDRIALWHQHTPLATVEIVARGLVETADKAGILSGLAETIRPAVYLRRTNLTAPDEAIRALASEAPEGDRLGQLHALSALVKEAIVYRAGATDATTTAAEAMAIGAGVCQDQAHVLIAAARALGIPARYVVGYLYDPDAEPREAGDEGDEREETHAWTEAHVDGLGWTGFDITHQLCPTDAYVRLACGLDAPDTAPVRGVFSAGAEETLQTTVAVRLGESQSQSQQ